MTEVVHVGGAFPLRTERRPWHSRHSRPTTSSLSAPAAGSLSRATYSKMIQNLVWATGYNVVAIPVAAGVLVPWGIDLPMAAGAIAMSVSTIVVAVYVQLLRGLRLRPQGTAAAAG